MKGKPDNNRTARPTAPVVQWMQLKAGMFIHFGINTFNDKEWSYGDLDPASFNPDDVDTDQWCSIALNCGMKYIVLVTKHIDGFCLWPSKFTKYSVASSPYKNDIVAKLFNSAEKHGLKVGLYYALWDSFEPTHQDNEPAYADFVINQLHELLTNYGRVTELWFDGFWKKQSSGWKGKISDDAGENLHGLELSEQRDIDFLHSWRSEGAYRYQFDRIYAFVKSKQPDCLVMNNSTTAYPGVPLFPVDIRSGEKYTTPDINDRKVWNWLGEDRYLPLQIETTMSIKGDKLFPSGNWFWHAWDHSFATEEMIMGYYKAARQMEANLLLNCGPRPDGRLREVDVNVLSKIQFQ